jgi:hypothetical protein
MAVVMSDKNRHAKRRRPQRSRVCHRSRRETAEVPRDRASIFALSDFVRNVALSGPMPLHSDEY